VKEAVFKAGSKRIRDGERGESTEGEDVPETASPR